LELVLPCPQCGDILGRSICTAFEPPFYQPPGTLIPEGSSSKSEEISTWNKQSSMGATHQLTHKHLDPF